jgi:circadian clock protein KaiC
MAHSNQIREFRLTSQGIDLVDVYIGPGGVLTGTARESLEAQERAADASRQQELERKRRQLLYKQQSFEAKIAAMRAEFEAERQELEKSILRDAAGEQAAIEQRKSLARLRKADLERNGRRT